MGPDEEAFLKANDAYKLLTDQWATFVDAVGLRFDPHEPQLPHSDPPATVCVELRYVFPLLGKRAFVRFDHDLTDGYLSYGVMEPGEYHGQERESVRVVYAFDNAGNVYQLGPNSTRAAVSDLAFHMAEETREFHFRNLWKLCAGKPFAPPDIDKRATSG
jgi:hypothetical protein